MVKTIKIENLVCRLTADGPKDKIAYVLYPMEMLEHWIAPASKRYGASIVVITGMDWQNVFSPWPAKGVPKGSPDFKGESPQFLSLLQRSVIPEVEAQIGIAANAERTLVGVSMSGLFALWQWLLCGTFANIASLSGSFWYEGFMEWFDEHLLPKKEGKAFFLLGEQEPKSRVKAFDTVGVNTRNIVDALRNEGVAVKYEIVPGNHYSNPMPRLNAAFDAIYVQGFTE